MALKGHDETYLAFLLGKFSGPVPAPITRSDFYLAKLCGFDFGPLPSPISVGDMLLREYVESGGSGSGVSYELVGKSGMFPAGLYSVASCIPEAIKSEEFVKASSFCVCGMKDAVQYSVATIVGQEILDY